ncbi:MAG: translation initiation factor [Planctomycetia bacterium]
MRLLEGTAWDRPAHCERCEKPEAECVCPPKPAGPVYLSPNKQTARLQVEKRAKGKIATIVAGLDASESNLPELLTKLKTACGAGGTLGDAGPEIQGRHLDKVRELLKELGYKVKG